MKSYFLLVKAFIMFFFGLGDLAVLAIVGLNGFAIVSYFFRIFLASQLGTHYWYCQFLHY